MGVSLKISLFSDVFVFVCGHCTFSLIHIIIIFVCCHHFGNNFITFVFICCLLMNIWFLYACRMCLCIIISFKNTERKAGLYKNKCVKIWKHYYNSINGCVCILKWFCNLLYFGMLVIWEIKRNKRPTLLSQYTYSAFTTYKLRSKGTNRFA